MPDNLASMSFDELLRRVGGRLDRYHRTQQAALVHGGEAIAETAALLAAAGNDQQRMMSAPTPVPISVRSSGNTRNWRSGWVPCRRG